MDIDDLAAVYRPCCLINSLAFCRMSIDGGGVIEIEQYRADIGRRLPGPIVERLLDEKIERHDQAAQIPKPDHHIGRGDLLDHRTRLHRHGVFKPDRLGNGELNAGDEIAQNRLRGKTEDHTGSARRGEQADAVLAYRVKGHQREAERQKDDHGVEHAHHDAYLRDVLARQEIVFNVDAEIEQIKIGGDLQNRQCDPAEHADGCERQQAREQAPCVEVERRGR